MAGVIETAHEFTGSPAPRRKSITRMIDLARAHSAFALGLIDQAIISGCSLILTLVLAHTLDVNSFGRFSVAWSFLILLESGLFRGLFDDGLPAVAHRLARQRWPQLRFSLYVASLGLSGAIGALLVMSGLIAFGLGSDNASLLVATGLAIPATRLQSVFRRLCYLDGRLLRVVIGAIIFFVVLALAFVVMIGCHFAGAAAALICVSAASAAAGGFGLCHLPRLARPQRRLWTWAIARLLRGGRWFVLTSLIYWISSLGLIPFCGALIGLEASASLRIILVVFAPLSQFNTSMLSVKLPRVAERLRTRSRSVFLSEARSNALFFGGASAFYGVLASLAGMPLLALLVAQRGFEVSEASLILMALALTLDGIWLGLALPLIAIGRPRQFLASRIAGLLMLCVSLPIAAYAWGLTGVIGTMVLSSVATVGALGYEVLRAKPRASQGYA